MLLSLQLNPSTNKRTLPVLNIIDFSVQKYTCPESYYNLLFINFLLTFNKKNGVRVNTFVPREKLEFSLLMHEINVLTN